jgi:ornithine cyclodeaminase
MTEADPTAPPAPVVLTEEQVRAILPTAEAVTVTRDALVAQAEGAVTQPDPWHLDIPEARGEVHVKGAYRHGASHFAVKLATGFYGNAEAGLPTGSGLSIVVDARTGFPVVIALDNGYLTTARTAAAGAIATDALARPDAEVVALIGPGAQGHAQMRALLELRHPTALRLFGGEPEHTAAFAAAMRELHDWDVRVAASAEEAVRGADIVITATPSRAPLVHGAWLSPGAHVTAIGADQPGKRELADDVLTRADVVAADDIAQSRRNGELQYGTATRAEPIALGAVLAGHTKGRVTPDQITIADLTGLGVEDAAVGTYVARALPTT